MLRIFLLACVAIMISCNTPAPAPTENNTHDTTPPAVASTDTFTVPPIEDLKTIVIGKGGCKLLKDTLGVRMTEFTLMPGDSVKVHSHPDHAFYVVQGGKLAVWFNGSATPVELELTPGYGGINGPLGDIAKNVGKTTIKLVNIDFYRPRAK